MKKKWQTHTSYDCSQAHNVTSVGCTRLSMAHKNSPRKSCVIYARVSSREQKEHGYLTEAQIALLKSYAQKNDFEIVEIYEDVETAKKAGRKNFNIMLKLLKKHKSINTILVEKTDRLYRNFKDYVTIDEIDGLEVHLVKENTILSENSRSHEKFIHGIKVLMAKNYIDNLSEEVKKGMHQKASQGNIPHVLLMVTIEKTARQLRLI